jgi:hypothetical protein
MKSAIRRKHIRGKMALLLSQDKMIDWFTKQISKYESLVNNNKEVKSKNKT